MQGFQPEDLNEDIDFDDAYDTPHRVHGKDKTIYWQHCQVSVLKKLDNGNWTVILNIDKRKGKGVLQTGETLMFIGEGGKVKEG
jgi:hypothetical protein